MEEDLEQTEQTSAVVKSLRALVDLAKVQKENFSCRETKIGVFEKQTLFLHFDRAYEFFTVFNVDDTDPTLPVKLPGLVKTLCSNKLCYLM